MTIYYKAASQAADPLSPNSLRPWSQSFGRRTSNKGLPFLLFLSFLFLLLLGLRFRRQPSPKQLLPSVPSSFSRRFPPDPDPNAGATIIVITPTYKRPERLADMTRFSQTLSHLRHLHWIVIEDANATVPAVERILQRTGLPYVYFHSIRDPRLPKRGWTHRNRALAFIRSSYVNYEREAVVYFADDDNVYDIRLFNNYIRNVKRLGFWAVGLAGAALVEAPHVEDGTIVSWDAYYAPMRTFATDMAGFAVNLREVLRARDASFNLACVRSSPENCFIRQLGIRKEEAEPFGYDDEPKEILVWHVKTRNLGTHGGRHGYVVE